MNHRVYIERLVIALGVIGLAILLWNLRGLVLLIFGAVLVSVVLNVVADPIRHRLGLPRGAALLAAVLIVVGLLGTAFWMFGAEVMRQSGALRDMIPAAWQNLLARLDTWGLGDAVRQWSTTLGSGGGVVSNFGNLAMSVGNAVFDTTRPPM